MAVWIDAVRTLIDEILLGPRDPQRTWVVSNQPGTGLVGTLDGISAAQASTAPEGRRSIAAHAEHVRVGLLIALAHIHNTTPPSWESSWNVQQVDETQWRSLRDSLRSLAGDLSAAMANVGAEAPADAVTGTIGTVAHLAYHLGAVRQLMLKC